LHEANDMSHDDPTTKDAKKNQRDRGGSSFLRTGSFQGLARPRARGAAFSLAAAVLLCGCRVPANARVFVHVDSPAPAELKEILGRHTTHVGGRAVGWTETRAVCASPCDRWIDLPEDHRYVITGLFPDSPTFHLPDLAGPSDLTSAVNITVQPGSYRRFWAGLFTTVGGVVVFGPGPPLLGVGTATGDRVMQKIAIGFMVPGGVTAIVGGVLLATTRTKIKVQRTGEGPVGRAAPVEPRYWMGEF
jgi:hypothetical protein